MSRTAKALFIDGQFIGYFPPANAEQVPYGNTNVKEALDGLSNSKADKSDVVSKSQGGIFNNHVQIEAKSTTTAEKYTYLITGNNTPKGTVGNATGVVQIYGDSDKVGQLLMPSGMTANRNYTFPDASGTLALTSDIYVTSFQQIVSVTANTIHTTSLDFAGNNIDTSKILNVTVTWNNPSDDVPKIMVYYSYDGGYKNYISRIQHQWSVAQNVRFIVLVLLKK